MTTLGMEQHKCLVAGLLKEKHFHKAKHVLQWLHESQPECFARPESEPLMEYQWLEHVEHVKVEQGDFEGCVAVYCDGHVIGGLDSLMQWVTENYDYLDDQPSSTYETLALDAYNTYVSNSQRDFVFMDVCIEGDLIGRLVFELYKDLCPQTCANFVALCEGTTDDSSSSGTKLRYVNSIFHRVVPGGWIQGGDICGGSGSKGSSIYGPTFNDESFAVKHFKAGVLGMANYGRNTNASQFYITLKPCSWMDKKYVAFGQVIEGVQVLKKLEGVATHNERPTQLCQVSNSGILQPVQ